MEYVDVVNAFIKEIADKNYESIYNNGHANAGVNGPYRFVDTPVRNSGHWLIITSYLWKITREERYKELAFHLANYIVDEQKKTSSGAIECMTGERFDHLNGLIGQAWTIEALVYAYEVFRKKEYLDFIYDENWENQGVPYPYEILTYLFDSYYVLPERPDLAALFCWQAINHSYYIQQLSDNNVGFCQDTKGVELVRDAILGDWNNKYKTVLEPFLKKMPDKTFHYVASYMLKGYAMEKKGIAEKYRATSYKSLKRKISLLSDILDNAYGKSYCQISNPTLIGNVVNLGIANANKRKSRDITHSFGMKLRALMLGKEVEITFCDVQRTKKKYKFTDEERLSFVLFGILYASRCNNFHGNVAARMNSINANKDTFKMYTDMILTEYIILAIHLNSQGALSDVVLNKVKKNANLMI